MSKTIIFILKVERVKTHEQPSENTEHSRRDMNFERIAKYFNPQKSDRENLATLADNGINISRSTLTRFKRANNYTVSKTERMSKLFDPQKTDRQNLAYFEENGLKVSQRMLTKYKKKQRNLY